MKPTLFLLASLAAAQTSNYPGAIDTDSSLFVVADNVQTTLTQSVATADNVIFVKSGTGFAVNQLVTICDATTAVATGVTKCSSWENMKVTAVNGQALTVTRGVAGTTARAHNNGLVVSVFILSAHQSSLKSASIAVQSTLGANLQGANPGPAWAGLNNNWADLMRNVGGYPSNAYFGNGSTGIPEAVRGAILIPSNVNADGAHGAGVAGYGLSASPTKGAVGTFGFGSMTANNSSAWGGNFLATNCGQPQCNPQTGRTGFNMQGVEIDVNVEAVSGGGAPVGNAYALGIIGASRVAPTGQAFAIHIDALNFLTPKIPWNAALYTEDGTAATAIDLGTIGTGNGSGSQAINFRSRDSGGTNRAAQILADPSANLVARPGAAGQIMLQDGNGNIGATVVPNGTAPYLYAQNLFRFEAVTFANLPAGIAPGVAAYCTNCTAAATCASGGSGHLAIYNGTAWTCQ